MANVNGKKRRKPGDMATIGAGDAMFREPDAPPPPEAKPISPERILFQAVIERAIHDAFFSSDFSLRNSENKLKCSTFDPEIIRGDARRWLVSRLDPWRTDRENICDMAGIDPNLIQDGARQKLREVRAAEREALEAGTECRRKRYPSRRRTDSGQRIAFEERAEDLARLVELVGLDCEQQKVERAAQARRRGERAAQVRREVEAAQATA